MKIKQLKKLLILLIFSLSLLQEVKSFNCKPGEIQLYSAQCVKSFDDCPKDIFRSEQRQQCSDYCLKFSEDGFLAEFKHIDLNTQIKSCKLCPYIYQSYGESQYIGQCTSCIELQLAQDEIKGACNDPFLCEGYLSENKSFCWKDSCKNNETLKSQEKEGKHFNCVRRCNDDKPYFSKVNQSCEAKCNESEFVDHFKKECFNKIEDCSGYLSSDRKTCSYRCPKSEIPEKRVDGQSYLLCQKCPSDKPFVSSDLLQCVASCSSTEMLQEKYNTCFNNSYLCDLVYEEQSLLQEENKCVAKCPNHYANIEVSFMKRVCKKCSPDEYIKNTKGTTYRDNLPAQYCTSYCYGDEVADLESKMCIAKEQCTGFSYQQKCEKACPSNTVVVVDVKDLITYKHCEVFVPQGYFLQTDINEYRRQCKEGELYSFQKCVKEKKDCSYLQRNGIECSSGCGNQEFAVKKEGYNECQFCYGYLSSKQKKDDKFRQCLDKCPNTELIVKEDDGVQVCIGEYDKGEYDLGEYNLSSNKQYYTKNCQFPEKIENNNCVSECSSENKYIFYDSYKQLKCTNSCGYKVISSNNKYCGYECQSFLEVKEEKDSNKCKKCNEGEYMILSEEKGKGFVCSQGSSDKIGTQKRFLGLKQVSGLELVSVNIDGTIILKEQYNYFIEQFQIVLSNLESNNQMKESLQDLVKITFVINKRLKGLNRYSPNIFQSTNIKLISQKISLKYDQQFSTSFSLSKLKSDNPNLTIPYSNQFGFPPQFNPLSLLFIISQKNFLCQDSKSSQQCYENTELILVFFDKIQTIDPSIQVLNKSPEFTLYFDISDNKNINQYVCLTTKDGIMTKSIMTEVSSNPKGIKCTFKDNVTLFFDSQCMFTDLSKCCPQDKPYKHQNQCVAQCPILLDPIQKLCVSKVEECTLISEDRKECIPECPKDSPYQVKISPTQNSCLKQCKENQILYQEKMQCLTNKNECQQFLIDDKICQQKCPPEKFQYKNEKTPYHLCTSNCEFISIESNQQNYCLLECYKDSVFATVNEQDKPLQKYCRACPNNYPFKNQLPEFTACYKQCKDNQITHIEENNCLKTKEECKDYLVNSQVCTTKECSKEMFKYIKEITPYKSCNSKCELFSYIQNGQKMCIPSCQKLIEDKEDKICYDQNKECPKFVSYNGKECSSKCGEEEEFQYYETIGSYKQCRVCRDFIKEEIDSNQKKNIKCENECGKDDMIYRFGKKNEYQKCVSKEFCEKKKSSSINPKICSDQCLKPEVNSGDKCEKNCPDGFLFSPEENNCTKNCEKFYSSDEKLCIPNCEKIFEVVDEQAKNEKKKKCKKCESNQYQSLEVDNQGVSKGVCKLIIQSEETRKSMKQELLKKFEQEKVQSTQEIEIAQKAITSFASQIEKTSQDQNSAKQLFESILEITQAFTLKIDDNLSQNPVKIAAPGLMVTAQVAYPGLKFMTTFSSNNIKEGNSRSLLEKDLDEASTKFVPKQLSATFVQNNHFCKEKDCKNYPPLFVVTYLNEVQKRMLVEDVQQTFQIAYPIPQGQEPQKQVCFSFDKSGKRSQQQGDVKNNQIICNFEYSSALFYDEKCEYINNKTICGQNDLNTKVDNDDDNERLSGGEIAGIAIGVIAFIGIVTFGVIYFLRKRKNSNQPQKKYLDQNEQEKVLQVYDNKVIETANDFDKARQKKQNKA